MKKALLLIGFVAFALAPVVAVAAPQPVYADAAADQACAKPFLTFPVWYRGLAQVDGEGNCSVASPDDPAIGGLSNFIWRIVLNVIEIGLQVVGYIAVFFIIYGGFQFLTGGDNPSKVEKARTTILNAVIGLIISIASIAIVNLVFGIIS